MIVITRRPSHRRQLVTAIVITRLPSHRGRLVVRARVQSTRVWLRSLRHPDLGVARQFELKQTSPCI